MTPEAQHATFATAVSLSHTGAYREAAELFRAVATEANAPGLRRSALFHLAHALAANAQFREACEALEHLLGLPGDEPSGLITRLKLIHCRVRAGEPLPAIPDLPAAITPAEAAAWIEAALSAQECGSSDTATRMFDCLTGDIEIPETLRGHALWHAVVGRLAASPQYAQLLVSKLLAYQGEDPPAALLWGKAIECLAQSPVVEPAAVEVIWGKLPATATEQLAGVLMGAAFALERHGHLEEARRAYERLSGMPGVPDVVLVNVHLRLGLVLDALGMWDIAVRQYELAAAVDCPPNIAKSHALFRLARSREVAEEYVEAAAMFNELRHDAVLDGAQRAEAQLRYAICLLRAGDKDRALVELEACRQGHGEASLKADIALAELYESARDVGAARECYQRLMAHPAAEPATKAAALMRLQRLKR